MKITILGWYGSETIGDRAIMAGILHLFSCDTEKIDVHLGSIQPHLSNRSVYEDLPFLKEITNNKLNTVDVFYSLSLAELKKNISNSDLVLIGGGPFLDSNMMFMLKYAFEYAKKRGVKTSIMGCGFETLYKEKFKKCSGNLVELSDVSIFRDESSVERVMQFVKQDVERPKGLIDPAFFAAQFFRNMQTNACKNEHIAVNLRHLFIEEKEGLGRFTINECLSVVNTLADLNQDLPVRLIPMHTYFYGGDDRVIENRIAMMSDKPNVVVQNKPLSLKETMDVYYNSLICVGMRFHAVVLQTTVNGKNYIMDYTDSKTGKISNLLRQLNLVEKYKDRYVHCENAHEMSFNANVEKVILDDALLNRYKEQYLEGIRKLLK